MSLDRHEMAMIRRVAVADGRYHPDAYVLVCEAVQRAIDARLDAAPAGAEPEVSGADLLDVIRHLLLDRYGPMARQVLHTWAVRETLDFGHIVFRLTEHGLLGISESDRLADFEAVYDFDTAFDAPFRSAGPGVAPPRLD